MTLQDYTVVSRRMFIGTIADLPYGARLAWAAILFEAERLRGKVKLPVVDLARQAVITVPEAADALQRFQQPDPYSSSKEHDGRRLLALEGEDDWYQVVTWEKHAAERESYFARLRQQRCRARKSRSVTVSHGTSRSVTKEPEPEPEPEQLQKERERLLRAGGNGQGELPEPSSKRLDWLIERRRQFEARTAATGLRSNDPALYRAEFKEFVGYSEEHLERMITAAFTAEPPAPGADPEAYLRNVIHWAAPEMSELSPKEIGVLLELYDPYWIAAAIAEKNLYLRSAKAKKYLFTLLCEKNAEGWAPPTNARDYVERVMAAQQLQTTTRDGQ